MSDVFEDEIYREQILDHYKEPHNRKNMNGPSHQYRDANPLCGDEITIFLKVKNQKIIEASFEGQGCAICIASSSLLTDNLVNKSIAEVMAMTQKDILLTLGINPEKIAPVRVKCAMLALRTTQKALATQNPEK